MAFGEIVINRDLMPRVEQFFRANRADVARAAGDKYIHADSLENFGGGESSKKKKPPSQPAARQRPEINGGSLEPAFFTVDISGDKILVALREVDDALDQPDDPAHTHAETEDDLR